MIVSKDEFYKRIYDEGINVHPYPVGEKYPYTSIFRFPKGEEWGRINPDETCEIKVG
jgi:hypothetical protein